MSARFLWVAFQIDSLCSQKSDEAILNALEDLPKDLPQTFDRILRKLHDSKSHDVNLCLKVFSLVTAAQRPLSLDEIREAISVEPGEKTWNTKKIVNNMLKSLDCCGSLLVVDEEHLTVHFAHHCVRQHLFSKPAGAGTDLEGYHLDADQADLYLGKISVTYLSFEILSTQLTKSATTIQPQKINLSSVILGSSLPPRANITSRLALKFLKSRGDSRVDIRHQLEEAAGLAAASKDEPHQDYSFLSYARDFWLYHTKSLDQNARKTHRLWIRLVSGQLTTVQLPWDPAEGRFDPKLREYIIRNEHWALLCEHFMSNSGLVWAGAMREITSQLLQKPTIYSKVRAFFDNALIMASADVDIIVFKPLSSVRRMAEDINLDASLLCASAAGHEEIVRLLIIKGANVNKFGEHYRVWSGKYRTIITGKWSTC